MTRSFLGALLVSILGLVTPAHGEMRALLVGVSDYDKGTGIADLRGPKNDVLLMQDVLKQRGATDVVIVADGVEGAGQPTLAGIEAGFAQITAQAETGDLIYIHLSGHGTRQHDLEGDETDGLDEVFLPSNVTGVKNGGRTIPNALTDDRIGALVAGIRAKGADVWLVMDSCHSGSGMRNISDTIAERQVNPETLGVDISAVEPAAVQQRTPQVAEDTWGGYLAFYATRSNDVAREGNLTKGEGDAQWYGIFTSTLAARLEAGQALSYRQLFQAVLSDMNRGGQFGSSGVQTPLWEGDFIDAPVFGGSETSGVTRFLLDGDLLKAGLVHGLQEGTLLALVNDVSDSPQDVVGFAQVEEAQARSAYVRPVAADCHPDSRDLCPYAGSLPEGAGFAQIELHPVDQVIRFSPVIDFATGLPLAEGNDLEIVFREALSKVSELSGISAEISANAYDVQVVNRGDAVWFGAATQIGQEPVGLKVSIDRTGNVNFEEPLLRILRAEQFAQTLDSLDGSAAFANPSPIEVGAEIVASDLAQLTKPGGRINPRRECRPNYEASQKGGFVSMEGQSDLKQCDILQFSAKGTRDGQRDVNRVHIDAQYCVNVEYELVDGAEVTRNLGDKVVICSDCPGDVPYSAGHERLYLLVSELEENAEALNLKGLVENCSGAQGTRSVRGEVVRSMLSQVGQVGNTRGNMGMGMSAAQSDVWVHSYRWRVVPRTEVFKAAGQ
ncbi:caspase family protein [Pseudopelagicola sp. nBUS_19]|uniref:caspase family protein n=1 Tax=Pseudopelagicola sp. nBUS_19 TaxID=3395316 RepID=UPI003EB753ED